MSVMKENGLSKNTYKRWVTWTKRNRKKSGTIAHAWANQERFPYDRTDPQDHDSRRNKNFTYNQNYPSRSVKS